jgi:hypothetical protein
MQARHGLYSIGTLEVPLLGHSGGSVLLLCFMIAPVVVTADMLPCVSPLQNGLTNSPNLQRVEHIPISKSALRRIAMMLTNNRREWRCFQGLLDMKLNADAEARVVPKNLSSNLCCSSPISKMMRRYFLLGPTGNSLLRMSFLSFEFLREE